MIEKSGSCSYEGYKFGEKKASEVSTSGNIIKERFINTFEQLAHFVCDNICIIVSFYPKAFTFYLFLNC